MKANELRIGNWIQLPQGRIVRADPNIMAWAWSRGERYPLQPIPLTPEILEKAGFLQHDDTFDWSLDYNFQINGHFTLISRNDTLYYIDAINTEIKYLHQLQNLYFALTGEELDIQL